MALFKLANILPNPFRQAERYPLRPEKIAALRASISDTGFWDNIVARLNPENLPELAYGHHRLEALRQEYDPDHRVDLIIRDLDDAAMIRIMANENMEEYSSDFTVTMETVRAVVLAYGNDKIELDKPKNRNPNAMRYAPSFGVGKMPVSGHRHPYTRDAVKSFLRWDEPRVAKPDDKSDGSDRVRYALQALEFVERGYVKEAAFVDLTLKQALRLVQQIAETRRQQEKAVRLDEAMAEHAAKQGGAGAEEFAADSQARADFDGDTEITREFAETLAEQMRAGHMATAEVPQEAQKLRDELIPSPARQAEKNWHNQPDLIKRARSARLLLDRTFGSGKVIEHLDQLLADDGTGQAYVVHLEREEVEGLDQALLNINVRATDYRNRIARALRQTAPTDTQLEELVTRRQEPHDRLHRHEHAPGQGRLCSATTWIKDEAILKMMTAEK